MRRSNLNPAALALAALATVLSYSPATAATFRAGGRIEIAAGDTLRDDLYACGGKVDIDGVVLGDVTVCGGNVNVRGTVAGDVLSAGGSTTVSGSVANTVRGAGGEFRITGSVGEDLVAACGRFDLASGARVGRDVLLTGGELDLDGEIGRDVRASGGVLAIGGPVGGDVRAYVGKSRLLEGANVKGDFMYTSENAVWRSSGASVGGKVEQRIPEGRSKRGPFGSALRFIYGWERALIGLLAIGMLLLLPFPGYSRRVMNALGRSPGSSLAVGVALLVAIPLAAITAGLLGLFMGGWWLGMGAMVLFGMTLALGIAVSGAFIGQRLLGRSGREVRMVWALLAGLAILTLACRLPIVGLFVAAIAAVFGLGALAIAARRPGAAATA